MKQLIFVIAVIILLAACSSTNSTPVTVFGTIQIEETKQIRPAPPTTTLPLVTPSQSPPTPSLPSPTPFLKPATATPADLPDLVTKYPSMDNMEPGFTRTLLTYVWNYGKLPSSPTTIDFWRREPDKEVRIDTVTVPALNVGYGTAITLTWNIRQKGGRYPVYVVVDPENTVIESNETNNIGKPNHSSEGLFVPNFMVQASSAASEYAHGVTIPITITAFNNTPLLSALSLTTSVSIQNEQLEFIWENQQVLVIPAGHQEASLLVPWPSGDVEPGYYGVIIFLKGGPESEIRGTRLDLHILEDPTVDNTDRRIFEEVFNNVARVEYKNHKAVSISCLPPGGRSQAYCQVDPELFPKIGQLTELESLVIYDPNELPFPPELGNLSKLRELDINQASISHLPSEIGNLSNLSSLLLEGNLLAALPPEIGHLTQLEELDLYWNKFSTFPIEITSLTNLKALTLSANQLIALPSQIGNLTNLRYLDLSRNKLSALPDEIGNLTNLGNLDLEENKLSTLPNEIGNLTNLRNLDLNGNKLSTLPTEIGKLSNLTELDLSANQLTSLPSEIGNLAKLERLKLRGNQLTTLPPEIIQLRNLKSLDLTNNNFAIYPSELDQMPNLQGVKLEGNPFYIDFQKKILELDKPE